MKAKTVSLAMHVHNQLSNYRTAMSFLITILVSVGFATMALFYQSKSGAQLLGALSPYLSTLVESQDRPEILRVTETKEIDLVVVHDGLVIGSTKNISEMDQPYNPEPVVTNIFGITFGEHSLIFEAPIQRAGAQGTKAFVVAYSPIRPIMTQTIFVALFTFFIGLIISGLSAYRMKASLAQALTPLRDLDNAIRSIAENKELRLTPILIEELESIRKTIMNTHTELENTKENLANERAKQLSAESYKRLIHDLHNPVAALRQMLRLVTDQSTDEASRQEAIRAVPRIADQMLNQVTAAKYNLENDPVSLREMDIRICLENSVQQIKSAMPLETDRIRVTLPDLPVLVAHDPDFLERAVKNLLENGLRACNERVELALNVKDGAASITVSDDGQGLKNSEVTLFLQGRGKSSKADRQAFGLASANHIVRSHGGKLIYRQSALGGACFEIRLGHI